MNKKIVFFIILAAAAAVLSFALRTTTPRQDGTNTQEEKLTVVASFYPLADFAQKIGRDKVTVINSTPAGAEPHDFEPTPQDMVTIRRARVFIYNGVGLEPWVDKVLPDLQAAGAIIVKSSQGITLRHADTSAEGRVFDPHFWLDPILAQKIVDNIARGLQKADSGNAAYYQANAAALKSRLSDLDQQFRRSLAGCAKRDILTSHQAFGYLATRYGLYALAIAGLSPDEEPSPQKLAQIAAFARQRQIKYIFFESLVSPRLAETIAREIGAQTLVFNPIEGLSEADLAEGSDYLSVQRENLANLKRALECT